MSKSIDNWDSNYVSYSSLLILIVTLFFVVATLYAQSTKDVAGSEEILLAAEYRKESIPNSEGSVFHEWTIVSSEQKNNDLVLIAVVNPKNTINMSVIDVQKDGRISELLLETGCRRPIVISNGGFYLQNEDSTRESMGLVVSNGQIVTPFRKRKYGGFIVWQESKLEIVPIGKFKELNRTKGEILQSSPIIVRNSLNDMNTDDFVNFNRVAVGFTAESELVVLGAFRRKGSAISLYKFADIAANMHLYGGPKIEAALAMDGGPSSGVSIPALKKYFGYNGPNFLPNAVCVQLN